jgi:acetoin utilization deacetylase AcuC-like enzyme
MTSIRIAIVDTPHKTYAGGSLDTDDRLPKMRKAAAEALKKGLVDGVDEWTAQDLTAGGYLARARTLMQEVAALRAKKASAAKDFLRTKLHAMQMSPQCIVADVSKVDKTLGHCVSCAFKDVEDTADSVELYSAAALRAAEESKRSACVWVVLSRPPGHHGMMSGNLDPMCGAPIESLLRITKTNGRWATCTDERWTASGGCYAGHMLLAVLDSVAKGSTRPAWWDIDAHFPDGHYYDVELLRAKLHADPDASPLLRRLQSWQALHFASAHIDGFPFGPGEDTSWADGTRSAPLWRKDTELRQYFSMLKAGSKAQAAAIRKQAMALWDDAASDLAAGSYDAFFGSLGTDLHIAESCVRQKGVGKGIHGSDFWAIGQKMKTSLVDRLVAESKPVVLLMEGGYDAKPMVDGLCQVLGGLRGVDVPAMPTAVVKRSTKRTAKRTAKSAAKAVQRKVRKSPSKRASVSKKP